MSMNDYILEYDHLYHRMTEHDMKLPDAVLAFKLLDGASLSQEERQLALAVGNDLKFLTIKPVLNGVFTKPATEPILSNYMATMQIKQKDVFCNKSGRFGSNRDRENVFRNSPHRQVNHQN